MKKMCALLVALAAAVMLCPPTHAVSVHAHSAVLMDGSSGRVLYEYDAHRPRLIASTTKLMTALVAAERAEDLEQVVTVKGSGWAARARPSISRPGRRSPCGDCCTVCCFNRATTQPW